MRALLVAILLALALPSLARTHASSVVIYRCTAASGEVTLQNDVACPKGSRQQKQVIESPPPMPAYRPPPLPVAIPQPVIEQLWEMVEADPATEITVDLVNREVRAKDIVEPFELDDYTRWRLMEGLDDIGLTLRHVHEIEVFEAQRPAWLPSA